MDKKEEINEILTEIEKIIEEEIPECMTLLDRSWSDENKDFFEKNCYKLVEEMYRTVKNMHFIPF